MDKVDSPAGLIGTVRGFISCVVVFRMFYELKIIKLIVEEANKASRDCWFDSDEK